MYGHPRPPVQIPPSPDAGLRECRTLWTTAARHLQPCRSSEEAMQTTHDFFAIPREWRKQLAFAEAALDRDEVSVARPMLERLASLLPDNHEARLYAWWARARDARYVTDQERAALEDLARRTLAAHQTRALPLCVLAHAALRRGEVPQACRLFRRAADANPGLLDAKRGVMIAERRLAHERAHATHKSSLTSHAVVVTIVVALASATAAVFHIGR